MDKNDRREVLDWAVRAGRCCSRRVPEIPPKLAASHLAESWDDVGVGWIFIAIVAVYSAAGYMLEKSGKVNGRSLTIAGIAIGLAYWIMVSLLPR